MTVNQSGSVGIGTTSPIGLLTLSSSQPDLTVIYTTDSNYGRLIFKENSTEKGAFQYVGSAFSETGRRNALELYNVASGPIVMYTAGTERMRISNTGVVTKPSQPAFKAGRSSNYSAGANSTIIFNDTSGTHFNIGGHYNTSTGVFTAPVAGVYIFSAVVIYQSIPGGTEMTDAFYIYKNSTLAAYSFRRAEYEAGYTGTGGYYVDHANTLLELAANDTVSIRNNRAFEIHGNSNYTYFYGYMLG
jgi:hypothetical protein